MVDRDEPRYESDEEAVFYNMSGVLAEGSYAYLEIGKPEMTLVMKDEIMLQIRLDHTICGWKPGFS